MSSAPANEQHRRSEVARCLVREAARRLGVSGHTVRKRIVAGLLLAIPEERGWTVILDDPMTDEASPAVLPSAIAPVPQAPRMDALPAVKREEEPELATMELAPLVALVERLTERNAQLVAEAARWQARVELLEEQLRSATVAPASKEVCNPPAPAVDNGSSHDERGIQRKLAHLHPPFAPTPPLLALDHVNASNGALPDEPPEAGENWWTRIFGR